MAMVSDAAVEKVVTSWSVHRNPVQRVHTAAGLKLPLPAFLA
jgi:hypothetical protein